MRFNKIEPFFFSFFAIIRIKWKLDRYVIIIVFILFIVLYESKLFYNIYIKKNIYTFTHTCNYYFIMQNWCTAIIAMLFGKRRKKKYLEIQWNHIKIQYHYLIITIILIRHFWNQDFCNFLHKISGVNLNDTLDLKPQNL